MSAWHAAVFTDATLAEKRRSGLIIHRSIKLYFGFKHLFIQMFRGAIGSHQPATCQIGWKKDGRIEGQSNL